jgi:hypothetical protein
VSDRRRRRKRRRRRRRRREEKAKAMNEVDAGRRIDKVPAVDAFVDQLGFYYNVMGTFIGMSATSGTS